MKDGLALRWFGPFQGILDSLQPPFDDGEVGKNEFYIHGGDVALYVKAAFGVGYAIVGKGPYHVNQRIGIAELAEQFAANPFSGRQALHGSTDVDVTYLGGDHAFGLQHIDQRLQAWLGDFGHANVCGETIAGKASALSFTPGQGIEDGGFAAFTRADDANSNTHQVNRTWNRGLIIAGSSF